MHTQRAITDINGTPYSRPEDIAASPRQSDIRPNAFTVIGTVAVVLALITANECSSVFHLSSLLYGCVLWGWWAVVASMLWKTGQRKPILAGFSFQSILLHIGVATVLGWAHLFALWSLGFAGMGWYGYLSKWSAFHTLLNLNRFGNEVLVYGFVFGLIGAVQCSLRIRSLELEHRLSLAQLRYPQVHLKPNVLFDTRDAITARMEPSEQRKVSCK